MKKIILLLTIFVLPIHLTSYSQELNAEQIYSKVNESIVTIYTFDSKGSPLSQGSGVIINEKGWVITNYHIYEGASKLVINHKGKVVDYSYILCLDPVRDILILKINKNSFPQLKIGNSNSIKVGQRIYTIGNPLGLENTISEGIISGIRSSDIFSRNFIQISAAISPGSSGGAVIDSKGQLIGITTMTFSKGQNLNFAIPINEVLTLYKNQEVKEREIQGSKILAKAFAEYDNENIDLAITEFKKCISLNYKTADVYFFLGTIYMFYPDLTSAIDCFEKSIKTDPNHTDSYFQLGKIYFIIERLDLAIFYHKKAIQTNPEFVDSYYEMSFVYIAKEDFTSALASLKKLRQIDPNYTYNYENYGNYNYGFGIVFNRKKVYDSAIVSLNKAITLQDSKDSINLSNYYSQLAESNFGLGNFNEAIDNNNLSIQYNPKNAAPYFGLGLIYQIAEVFDEAIIFFNRTIELEPDNPLPYYRLSLIYEAKGDTKQQKYYRTKASNLDPRFK